ncbi:MAG: hypothetical protein ABIW46_01200, partial [Acidimicrobiales bacterium]
HAVDQPPATVALDMTVAGTAADPLVLVRTASDSTEFTAEAISLPAPVVDTLAGATGAGRVSTGVDVFSTAVLDLTIEALTLSYDPFRPVGS